MPLTETLVEKCYRLLRCDHARISYAGDKMFLIVGFNKNTKNDTMSVWTNEYGEIQHWDFLEEKPIAMGSTEEELLEEVKEYVILSDMTMKNYLDELVEKEIVCS